MYSSESQTWDNFVVSDATCCSYTEQYCCLLQQLGFDNRFWLTLSLLRVINVKILLQPHKKYDITQYGELDFS